MFDQDEIIAKIKEVKPKVVAIIHGETSTGRLQPIDRLGAAVREVGGFLVVDAVASFMGAPVKADEWQIDAVVGGLQKCLGALPGMSLVTFNDRPVCGRN